MRRTYRSKKDTGGGIDHRDMVLSVDSKSSVFDAFYIQNIKQVKRELSCVSSSNPYTVASNRVRKRKYVKRLKESEPLKESSAYLTPDKSIHVNKTPDLFDQLLNTSTNVESSNNTKHKTSDLFSQMLNCSRTESPKSVGKYYFQKPKTTTRTYCRKKPSNFKKNMYSSIGDSDDDKENTISDESNISHNTSNIKAYKLVIEKENISSPIHLDDSITKMVEQLPVLSKLNQNNSQESLNSCRFSTIQFDVSHSPQIPNSPQCSTPFHEKHRSKSIYRFSPVQNNFANSFEMITTIDENKMNETALHDDKDAVISEKFDSLKTDKTGMSDKDIIALNDEDVVDINDDREVTRGSEKMQKNQCANYSEMLVSSFSTKNEHQLSNETSSLQITGYEPFLGFSGHNSAQNESDLVKLKNYKKIINENCSVCNNISDLAQKQNIEPHISLEAEEKYDSNTSIGSKNESSVCYDLSGNNTSVESEDISVSSYNTCDSDNLCEISSTKEVDASNKEAIVVLEKMSDSLFHKYYEKMADYSTQDSSSGNSDKEEICNSSSSIYESEYASFEELADNDSSNSDAANVYKYKDKDNKTLSKQDLQFTQCNISSSENDSSDLDDENVEEEEEKYVSFVTTRRKVRKTNDSLLLNLDNSYFSNSSGSLEKTVLSNNEEKFEKSDIIENKTLVNDYIESNEIQDENITEKGTAMELTSNEPENKEYIEPELDYFDEQITNVNTRKSSRLFRENCNESRTSQVMADGNASFKVGIVLKPGKKWERSLSIYRRMTTMGDNFNHSILDKESIKNKGRKYRQSVISTMEMQESLGLLHNESVFSRRSTFVSKPNRSTIKIVRDPNASTLNLSSSVLFDDLQGFLNEDCDDTIVELSKLSIGDSGHEITVLEKFHDTSNRIVSARDYVLRRCNQTDSILFDECYPDTVLKNCRKIGEGVYGEVYLFRAGDGRARVMKIVPIAGTTKVNGEDQKDFHEIISEIVIAMELSALRAPIPEIEQHSDEGKGTETLDLHAVQNATDVFNEVLAVRCVHGSYPSRLLDLWELYDETKGSENDSPAELPADQQYLVLELANAGQDLESYQFNNAEQACALFKQIALGLAVAEEALQFEHRDLHWGNVLIAPTDQKYATFVIRGRLYRTARCGVAATLIDYSLSRASRGGKALYNDLADDDALFDAVGDYQFEVYRLMRDKLGNDWKNFEPYTNILWLHYTVDKMITALRYTRTNTKIHKHYIAKLKEIKNRILDYGSATQFVLTDNEF